MDDFAWQFISTIEIPSSAKLGCTVISMAEVSGTWAAGWMGREIACQRSWIQAWLWAHATRERFWPTRRAADLPLGQSQNNFDIELLQGWPQLCQKLRIQASD